MTEEERYAKVEQDKQNAINTSNNTYSNLLQDNDKFTEQHNAQLEKWQQIQNDTLDKNTQFLVDLQNQNKEKAEKEFNNEAIASKNAYYDFINPYGAQAEIQAQNGLSNSGYSETTKLGAWNIQQNRTAQARATMNDAKLQFDNAIKEAYLNNDTQKAQIALELLKQQMDEAARNFNTKSELTQNQLANNQALDSEYQNRWDTVWSQINTEKEQKEAIRQFEENYKLQLKQYQESIRQFDENIKYLKEKDAREYELQIKKLEEQKRQAEIQQAQWEKEYQLSLSKLYASGGGGYGSSEPELQDSSYYFNNGYQPRYADNSELSSSGLKVKDVFYNAPVGQNQNVWKAANGNYYVWIGDGNQGGQYVNVTSEVKASKKQGVCLEW